MLHKALILASSLTLSLTACDKEAATPTRADTPSQPADTAARQTTQTAPLAAKKPLPALEGGRAGRALGEGELQALMKTLGCPEDRITASGCEVCPPGINPGASADQRPWARAAQWMPAGVFSTDPREAAKSPFMHAIAGPFAALGGKDGVFLQYSGCPSPNTEEGGASHSDPVAVLVSQGKAVGEVLTNADQYALEQCAFPRNARGELHVVCVLMGGKGGHVSVDVVGMTSTTAREAPLGAQIRDVPGYEVEGEEVSQGDELSYTYEPGALDVAILKVLDMNSDGDEDLRLRLGPSFYFLVQQDGNFIASGAAVQ